MTERFPSIIIPSHNQLLLLKNLLRSLETQTWRLDRMEVIVVDDGSKDGTADFLRSYPGKLQLRPVFHEFAEGRSGARNAGIQIAAGDPIILVDGDMEVVPEFVQSHVETGKGEAVVLGRVYHHPDLPPSALKRYYLSRGAWKTAKASSIPGRYFVTLNASLPRWVIEKVGLLDENFRGYGGEDLDYGVRLQKARVPIRVSEEARSFHNHLRPLSDILNTVFEYGKSGVPYLVEKHPELFHELRLSLAVRLRTVRHRRPGSVIKNVMVRFLCLGVFYYRVRGLALILEPFWIPSGMINYLIFRNYSRGYLWHVRKQAAT